MYPLVSPRLGFCTLNLATPMALRGVPLVNVRVARYVLYTGSNVTSWILKRLYNLSFVSLMNTPEQILHDRVNLICLVRRLDKSVNGFDWGCRKARHFGSGQKDCYEWALSFRHSLAIQ
jgi:hypothetical protein